MTTRRIRALHIPAVPGLSKFVAIMGAVLDVFAEAQQMALDADKRYPFVEG